VQKLETEIEALEEKKTRLEELLSRGDVFADAEKSAFYTREYEDVVTRLEKTMETWAEASE
jgi:protein subunit release factor A